MLNKLKLRSIKKEGFSEEELDWLKLYIKFRFKDKITEEDIIFTKEEDEHLTFFRAPKNKDFNSNQNAIPKKFLQQRYIVTNLHGEKCDNEYFANIELIFWYFDTINDIYMYKDHMDRVFHFVIFGKDSAYDELGKGYKILDKHFKEVWKDWSEIDKTLLIGFAIFIKLFRSIEVKSLLSVFEGIKNKSLKYFGLSDANRESFGKVSHYEKLDLCWNCGGLMDAPGGLCSSCYDYWDEKTK